MPQKTNRLGYPIRVVRDRLGHRKGLQVRLDGQSRWGKGEKVR